MGATAGLSSSADSTVRRANRGTRQFRHDKRLAILWYSGSLLACLLGMACKEVMVSAPLVVLLYDRTFCAGSFREAWRQRYPYYLALAATWLLLAWLVMWTGVIGSTAGPAAQVHLVVVFADAAGRDCPLPSANGVAIRLVPRLRLACRGDSPRDSAAGVGRDWSAGLGGLGVVEAAGLGPARRPGSS